MELHEPLDPSPAGAMGLGGDANRILLVAQEALAEDEATSRVRRLRRGPRCRCSASTGRRCGGPRPPA